MEEGSLNNICLLLIALEAEKSKINTLYFRFCSWWGPPSWLADSCVPRDLLVVRAQKEPASVSPLLIKTLILLWGSTFMTSSNPDYLPKILPPNSITLGVWASMCEWGRDSDIQCIRDREGQSCSWPGHLVSPMHP